VVGENQKPVAKVRTEAQQARNKKKFQKLKEKRLARERQATQAHRLAKRAQPTSDPDTASCPPTEPTPPTTMEVDIPTAKDETSEEQVESTNHAQPQQATEMDTNPTTLGWKGKAG